MKPSMAFGAVALLAGIFSVGAAPLKLSELTEAGLAEKSISVSDFLAQRRSRVRAVTAPSVELLVKFQSLERVRVLEVAPENEAAALKLIAQRGDVAFAEKNRKLRRQFAPSDPLLADQWQHDKIQSRRAWDFGLGSNGVVVAIVDSPFNLDHPDLAANAVHGWDVVNEVPVTSGDAEHATFSAGMAAGGIDNATGIAGMANCQVMPINVTGEVAEMVAAIEWASSHGVRIVNISWTGADSDSINAAAANFRNDVDGIVVMAGVNGSGFLDYTNQPYIVAVSMTDSADALRSKYGDHVDFSAPGWLVKSTTVSGYGVDSGTSFSTPLVAGMLADLFSIDPALTAEQALSILRKTAVDLGDPGWDQKFGWGRVDFYSAAWLAAAHGGANPPVLTNSLERAENGLLVSTEFHPGLDYSLFGKDSLDSTNWIPVDAVAQTNGGMVDFMVPMDSTQAFYRVVGDVVL